MDLKQAIIKSALGVAVGVGVLTAATGTAQADVPAFLGDLAAGGIKGPDASMVKVGDAVCKRMEAGANFGDVVDWLDANAPRLNRDDAQFFAESAAIFLCLVADTSRRSAHVLWAAA